MRSVFVALVLATVGCNAGVAAVHDAAADLADHDARNTDVPPAPQFYVDPYRLCPNADAGAPDSGNVDASDGGDSDASDGGTRRSGCPMVEPTGGTCAVANLRCDYGDAINLSCRRRWLCFDGNWRMTGGCAAQSPPACPVGATPDAGVCMNLVDLECSYSSGDLCGCYEVGSPPKCLGSTKHLSPGCPAQLPYQGTDCSLAAVYCGYGGGTFGWDAVCCHGSWQVAPYVIIVGP